MAYKARNLFVHTCTLDLYSCSSSLPRRNIADSPLLAPSFKIATFSHLDSLKFYFSREPESLLARYLLSLELYVLHRNLYPLCLV